MPQDNMVTNRPIIIAARERGPGPGRYKLPSCCGYQGHDPTKTTMPQYSFGKRVNPLLKMDCGPGPSYHVNSNITRYGVDGTPMYSILGRGKVESTFKTPSPSAYYAERVHPQGEKHAPAYSMGTRTAYQKRQSTPSPNSYALPSLLGSEVPNKTSSAAYSMAARATTGTFSEDLAKSPGPGRYNYVAPSIYAYKAPAYSMLGRSYMPGDSTKKPGPGAHSPEKVNANKPSPPSFSLGIRHSEYLTPLIIEVRD